jgi:hypothetical protein
LGQEAGAGLEEIGDAVAMESLEGDRILDGLCGGFDAVDIAEREDFRYLMTRIEAALLEALIIGLGLGGEREDASVAAARGHGGVVRVMA